MLRNCVQYIILSTHNCYLNSICNFASILLQRYYLFRMYEGNICRNGSHNIVILIIMRLVSDTNTLDIFQIPCTEQVNINVILHYFEARKELKNKKLRNRKKTPIKWLFWTHHSKLSIRFDEHTCHTTQIVLIGCVTMQSFVSGFSQFDLLSLLSS